MNVGIICYASVGGSGVVATELAKALSTRGHRVHLMSADPPFRLGEFHVDLSFHQVQTPSYPLFREPQYLLSLANKVVQVARAFQLDIVHAHYAIPHATAALLSKQVLEASGHTPVPRVITTLHGTDITVVGNDPSYSEIVAFSIEKADGATAVSESLRRTTRHELNVRREIAVIPNFLDCSLFRRVDVPELRRRITQDPSSKVVIHVSNFRPVKRIDAVVAIFARICRKYLPGCCSSGTAPSWGRSSVSAASLASTIASMPSAHKKRSSRCCPRRTSSCSRQHRRASAWPRSKPWPAAFRWSHPTWVACLR